MWQVSLSQEALITVNYEDTDLPLSLREFKPILFKEKEIYFCLLGPDPQEGIFGFGRTITDAIRNWDLDFKNRLYYHSEEDRTAKFVLYKINILKKQYVK